MKTFVRILPVIFCSLLMAAHSGRANMPALQIISLLIPFILIWKSKIAAIIMQILLLVFGLEWIRTLIVIATNRMENGEDWIRMAIILGIVALFNFASILIFRTKQLKKRYQLE